MANHRLTHEEFERRFNDLYDGKFTLISQYEICTKPLTIRCNTCGESFTRTRAKNVLRDTYSLTCPYCNPKKVTNITIRGVDDLWTTDRDVAELLLNPEDGYTYGRGSGAIVDFKCPHCGKVVKKSISVVVRAGFSCNYCGDGYSYPNKFMMGLLDKTNISFIPEFHFPNTPYRYDFKFEYNGEKYLVEMDGAYGHGSNDTKSLTVEEQLEIDRKKDELALEMGFKIIRVDCKYNNSHPDNRFKYVYSSIKSSELAFIIDLLTYEDILEVDMRSNRYSKFLEFVDLWNEEERSYDHAMSKLHITKHTILDYAKRAIELGLIDVDYKTFTKTMSRKGWDKISKNKSTPVMCNETGEVFKSIKEAQEVMNCYNISYQISGRVKHSGRLPDGTLLTWKKITYEEYLRLKSA